MSTESKTENSLSSRLGREWLSNTKSEIVMKEVSVGMGDSKRPAVKTIGVSIPDVTATPSYGEVGRHFSDNHQYSAIVSKALKRSDGIDSDLAEPPSDWTDDSQEPVTRKPAQGKSKTNLGQKDLSAIDQLCNAILARFPLGDPSVLLFVGSEVNRHVDETSARVASRLAQLDVGRVLLLDSDLKIGSLSQASGLAQQNGICDVTNRDLDWKPLVFCASDKLMDFLPSGTEESFRHPDQTVRLANAVADMKQKYQFIIVSAGDAHQRPAKIWSELCDGSYLLVSMKTTNKVYAKSAVAELQASGARLLGCVVADAV